jgi:hypothetical protein
MFNVAADLLPNEEIKIRSKYKCLNPNSNKSLLTVQNFPEELKCLNTNSNKRAFTISKSLLSFRKFPEELRFKV